MYRTWHSINVGSDVLSVGWFFGVFLHFFSFKVKNGHYRRVANYGIVENYGRVANYGKVTNYGRVANYGWVADYGRVANYGIVANYGRVIANVFKIFNSKHLFFFKF